MHLLELRWTSQLVESKPSLLETDVSLLAYHQVIQHLDVEYLARFDQTPCDQYILMVYVEDSG